MAHVTYKGSGKRSFDACWALGIRFPLNRKERVTKEIAEQIEKLETEHNFEVEYEGREPAADELGGSGGSGGSGAPLAPAGVGAGTFDGDEGEDGDPDEDGETPSDG